ncbi:hypothetical protein [Enterococcus sp. AZ103]|uniref:hypothetical protein n=1 Tax=Enterococcus sp. AZ103 TaxID=2774628 RepID=UPI003F25A26F
MALIDRKVPKSVIVENEADTTRNAEKEIIKKGKIGSTRKNIKVSPSTLNLIKAVCTMKSMKNYELVDEAIEYYIKNTMSEREQRILKNLNQ